LNIHTDIRDQLGRASTLEAFNDLASALKQRLIAESNTNSEVLTEAGEYPKDERGIKKVPHWLCQPWVRPPNTQGAPKDRSVDQEEGIEGSHSTKRKADLIDGDPPEKLELSDGTQETKR
ncbi:hypothetical protein HDU93_004475, partial [Gonapodya sp. JEL0774]